jgi:predicted phage terminase large subunit-like protein
VDGIETAMSRDRLDKLWQMYYTDLRQRKIGDCVELHVATRWSLYDPIGRLEMQYEGNPAARFLRFPAVNDNDESNFDYPYGVGFTTEFYRQQREIMDDASWDALYMNEPIERQGVLFEAHELRRYFSLPDKEPDDIIAVCDTKDSGPDYCVMPIAYKYGTDYYIEEIICDNGKPDLIEERLVETLIRHNVRSCRFESNRGAGRVAESVQERVKERGGITRITTKWTQTNKDARIVSESGPIKTVCLFKDESLYTKEYRQAITMLTNYTMGGKVKHDDVPDAFSMLSDFIRSRDYGHAIIMQRPF